MRKILSVAVLIASVCSMNAASADGTKELPKGTKDFLGTYQIIECTNLTSDNQRPETLTLEVSQSDKNTLVLTPEPYNYSLTFKLRVISKKTRDSDPTECSKTEGTVDVKKRKTPKGKVAVLLSEDRAGSALCIPPYPPEWAIYKDFIKSLALVQSVPNGDEFTVSIAGKDESADVPAEVVSCNLKKVK